MIYDYVFYLAEADKYEFRPCPQIKRIDISGYRVVYSGKIEAESENEALEALYTLFNINHPADYKNRSMSLGDIVKLGEKLYYCDSFGFAEVEWDLYPMMRLEKSRLVEKGLEAYAYNKTMLKQAKNLMALKTDKEVVAYCQKHCTPTSDRSVTNWQRWCDLACARLYFMEEN